MKKPAVAGGAPVREQFLPFNRPSIDNNDIAAAVISLTGDVLSMGGKVKEFERAFAAYTGSKYAVAVSSGSAGLHIALLAAGIGHQEEVVCTSLTHPGTTHCILYQKAVPIYTDISLDTYNIDPDEISTRLTRRTRAIIVTHYAGLPCDRHMIEDLAGEKNLLIIEDATMALGAEFSGGIKVGTAGRIGVFDFSGVNGLATGEGGMVITSDEETFQWLNIYRNMGIVTDKERFSKYPGPWHREVQDLGFNYRLTEMQAALGLSQLGRADQFIERRNYIAGKYNSTFSRSTELIIPPTPENVRPSWDIYPLRINTAALKCGRRELFEALLAENIGVDVLFQPVYLHPYYVWIGHPDVCTISGSLCPQAEKVYESLVCLPVYPAMTDQDVEDVIEAVQKVVTYYRKKL
jgi:dTDP-4-amino-4,6-dideoxygalactose transaminase